MEPDWDKLGADLNLSSLTKGLGKKATPKKLIEFAKAWEKLSGEENLQVDIKLTFSITGEGAREVQKFLMLYKYLKYRGELGEMTQNEFLERALVVGCIRHNVHGDMLTGHAKYVQKMLIDLRDNPEKYRKDLEDAVQGNDFFNEFTE